MRGSSTGSTRSSQGGGLRWHPFFESAYSGGGFTLGAGHDHYRQRLQHHRRRAAATRSPATSALEAEFVAPRLFNRRGSLSLLGGWREATQVGFYGIGTDTSKDDRTNYLLPAAVRARRSSPSSRRAACLMLRGGVEFIAVVAGARRGHVPVGGDGLHAADAARPRRRRHLPAHAGHGRDRLAHVARLRAPRRLLRRDAARLHATATRTSASSRSTTRPSSTFRSCARRGCSRSAARVQTTIDKDGQQIPFFMLPSLGGGSSLRGYQQLALPRPEQPAAAGGVAHHGQPLPRHGVLLRRRQGDGAHAATSIRRPEGRLRLRRPLPRAVRDAAARRAGQEPRRPRLRVRRRPPSF